MTLDEKWAAYNAAWEEFMAANAALRQHVKRLGQLLGLKIQQSIIASKVRKLNHRGPWPQTTTPPPKETITFKNEDDYWRWLKLMSDGMDLHDRRIMAQRARIKQAQRQIDPILARIDELEAAIDHQTGRPPLAPPPSQPKTPPTEEVEE